MQQIASDFEREPTSSSGSPTRQPVEGGDLARLGVDELERLIAELEGQIAPVQRRIAKLRRVVAAKKGGAASGPARQVVDEATVLARYKALGSGRDAAAILASDYGCSLRTIHRKLISLDRMGYRRAQKS